MLLVLLLQCLLHVNFPCGGWSGGDGSNDGGAERKQGDSDEFVSLSLSLSSMFVKISNFIKKDPRGSF
jgi:hypothetical protein